MSGFDQFSAIAGGDIRVHRCIKMDTSANSQVLEANAGELCRGITTGASKEAPLDGVTALAAADGDVVEWLPPGRVGLLTADATGWTRGDLIMSDNEGLGDVASDGNYVIAQAIDTTAASATGEVWILSPFYLETT
jgi:hypothetical protein